MGAMKEIAQTLEERRLSADDCELVVTRSTIDDALLIIADTRPGVGRVRIDLNDGTVWDGDPEQDIPELLDNFTMSVNTDFTPYLLCLSCNSVVFCDVRVTTLRAHVAAARVHRCAAPTNHSLTEGVTL